MKQIYNPERVIIFDTTMRDGNQAIGVDMTIDGRIAIARQLDGMGVNVIEAGFPASGKANSSHEFEAVSAVANEISNATVAALCRALPQDIENGWGAIEAAKHKGGARLHVFKSTSDIHMQQQGSKPELVVADVKDMVALAKTFTEDVEFSPMDATRSNFNFLMKVCLTAAEHGATTINLPDTVGYMDYRQYGVFIANAVKEIHKSYPKVAISAHTHNDRDMATASALEAIASGARQVEVSVNGIGERAGNARLATVVSAIREGTSFMPSTVFTDVDTKQLTIVSKQVSDISGRAVAVNEPVTGRYVFAHGSGIHQDGVTSSPNTYEALCAEDYGQMPGEVVVGSLSGRAAIKDRLNTLGIRDVPAETISRITVQAKEKAVQLGRDLADNDIYKLYYPNSKPTIYFQDIAANHDVPASKKNIVINSGQGNIHHIQVNLEENAITNAAKAISEYFEIPLQIEGLRSHALSPGTDAAAGTYLDVSVGASTTASTHRQIRLCMYAEGKSVDESAIKAFVQGMDHVQAILKRQP